MHVLAIDLRISARRGSPYRQDSILWDGSLSCEPQSSDRCASSHPARYWLFQGACLSNRLANFRPERQNRGGGDGQLVDADGQEGLQPRYCCSSKCGTHWSEESSAHSCGSAGGHCQPSGHDKIYIEKTRKITLKYCSRCSWLRSLKNCSPKQISRRRSASRGTKTGEEW